MSDFKTISEVADQLHLPQHVLRFWESQFSQIKPAKRRGGRRFYNTHDLETIQKIQNLLYVKGYTIKGAKKALNQNFMPFNIQQSSTPQPTTIKAKQTDLFSLIEKPAPNKSALNKILQELRAVQTLLDLSSSRQPSASAGVQ